VSEVDERALAGFKDEYGPELPPVAIVIAAYNEEKGIGGVVDSLPATICGHETAVIVVVDGSSDDTAEMARKHGAMVCDVPVNRGQGAALRLGYRIAREGGAGYIVTTDADGQYDSAQMPVVLEPVLRGEADFVTGSRRLGRQETYDRVRRAGVHVFAWLVSRLTGQRITDTTFGMRAMRAEVTAAVTLNQPQYQASELLIGAISRGYRVMEVPATMRRRAAGKTKKGGNLVYGYRFSRVVVGTWWRERRTARRVSSRSRSRGPASPPGASPEPAKTK
jgi:glycosyltransferase involved in cell wall biosynthesis